MSDSTNGYGPVEPDAGYGPVETAPAPAAPMPPPASITAYRAARSGVQPEQAAQALALAPKTGLSPQFVADNLQEVQDADQQRMLTAVLGSLPVTSEYAGQSAVHAAAVKDDVTLLKALEIGLGGLAYDVKASRAMDNPQGGDNQFLINYEQDQAAFAKGVEKVTDPIDRFWLTAVQQLPSLAAYGVAAALGGGAPGLAGSLFWLNRGRLYRQIWANAPIPASDAEGVFDSAEFDAQARKYANKGAMAAGVLAPFLGGDFVRALPGASALLRSVGEEIVVKSFAEAAAKRAAEWGGHTLSGALMMGSQAVAENAAVQKAVTGEVDYGKAVEAGKDAFVEGLAVAGLLGAIEPGRALLADMGRIREAPLQADHLDAMVEVAKASKLASRSPQEAEKLLGKMAEGGDATTVYIDSEALQRDQKTTQAVVEALADEGQAVAQAQATGGDVAVPVEKYLVRMGDQHDALREDVKLDPEGLTPRQAEELRRELDGWQQHATVDQNAQTLETKPLPELAAEKYGGTPEQWAQIWTPETVKKLGAALNPEAAPVEVPPKADSIAWAKRLADEGTIAELQPGRYELAARRSEDKLAQIAKASAEKGQEAARQGFLGAGAQEIGSEQTPKAGEQNLREAGKKADKAAKLLAGVPMLERARDLARAQAQVHADIRTEMDKARKYLADRDTERFRGDLAKADPAYLGAFDALLDTVDENTPRAPAHPLAIDTLLDRMDRDAEPLGFDPEALRATLIANKGWPRLTPPEARNVLDAVKNIRSAARRQNEIALSDRKANLRDFVAGVQEHLAGTPDSGLPAPSRASEGTGEKIAKGAHAVHAELLQPREILRRLGPNGEAIYDAFVKARNAKEALARDVGDAVWKMYEFDLPKALKASRFDGVKGPGSPVFKDNLWTRQDLWEFASWWGSKSGSDRIKAGLRITDGQAHEFLSQLTNAEADFLDAKFKLNDEKLWPLIRDHAREVTGVSPPKIDPQPYTIRTAEGEIRELRGGYEPARYRTDFESTAKAPENATSIADYWGSLQDGFPSTARYFLKERAQNVARVPDLNWSMYAGHVGSVLHYLAYDDFVRNVGRVFRDTEFRETVQRRLGPQEMKELDKFLGVSARGYVDSAQDGASNLSRIVGGGLRSRLATAAFQLNPRVVLGQLSHLPAAAAALHLGPRDMLYGLSEALRPSTWGESFGESQQLPYRWNGFGQHMRQMLADIGPADRPTSRKWLDAAGWSAYHAMDGFLSKAIYEAAASKAERARASPADAAKAGDNAVATMMPPVNLAEQSSFARDRGVVGSLILVRNFPNTLYNVGAMLEWNARNQMQAADPGWQRAKVALGAYGSAAASYLGTVWAAHILGRFLMGHGRQPDESTGDWLEREALSAPFYPVPLVSEVAATVAQAAVTRKTLTQAVREHGIASAPAIAEIERSIRDLGTVIDAPRSEDRVFAGLRLAANALRLPSEPLRGVQYGYDLMQGSTEPRGPFDVAGGFFYGKRRRRPKNPATLAQDFLSGD